MKKNNIKPLVMSALTALAMGAVGTVGTFALFTDKAETEINIGAGIVKIGSTITLEKYESSVDGTVQSLSEATSYTNTLVGSSFSLNDGAVNISKMVPGDKLTLKLSSVNKSNIKTKTRYMVTHQTIGTKTDLFPGLKLTFTPLDPLLDEGSLFRWHTNDAVEEANLAAGVEIYSALVTIELPDSHNGKITFGAENKDNQYQDAACLIRFDLQAVQANASTDPIQEINDYLRSEFFLEGANDTMHDAVLDMDELGYNDLDILEGYVYDLANDQFVAESGVTSNQYKYFKVASNLTEAGSFSVYADDDWNLADVEVDGKSFDVGDVHTINSVSYINTTGNARENLIRTNSLDTDVTINASTDIVRHYGDARYVNVIAVAGSSYHEYGRVAFFEVANGRVALESTAEVSQMHFAANENQFNNIVVAYDEAVTLPTFSRDAVAIADGGTLVVELQNSTVAEEADSDYVWLYQQGLMEQIRVSETSASAGTVKATDQGVKQETSKAAEEIANTIRSGATYSEAEIASGAVEAEDVVDVGLTVPAQSTRQEAMSEYIEESITEAAKDASPEYVARIGGKFYTSFGAAFTDAISGKTIRVIRNCNALGTYNASGKDLTLHVEDGVTLSCGNVANGKFETGWNNDAGLFAIEGTGTITFAANNNWGLITQNGSGNNITASIKDIHLQADESNNVVNGYAAMGANMSVESGYFKNVLFYQNTTIRGGLFNVNPKEYPASASNRASIASDKTIIESENPEYPWTLGDYDPSADADFMIIHANSEVEYVFRSQMPFDYDVNFGDKKGGFPNYVSSFVQSGDTVKYLQHDAFEDMGGNSANFFDFTNKTNVTLDMNGAEMSQADSNGIFAFDFGDGFVLKNAVFKDDYGCIHDQWGELFPSAVHNLKVKDTAYNFRYKSYYNNNSDYVIVNDDGDYTTIYYAAWYQA